MSQVCVVYLLMNVRFEMIKGLHLTVQPFSEVVLTPTLKVKR